MYSKERKLNVIYNVCGDKTQLDNSKTLYNPIKKSTLTLNDVFNLYNNDNLDSKYVITDKDIEGIINGVDVLISHFESKYVEAMKIRSEMYEVTSFNKDIENKIELYNAAFKLLERLKEL